MREIKFRAWDGQDTMIYFDFNSIRHDGLIDWNENKYSDTGGGLYIDNCDVMQYTGLKDKNGKEIYEGDVVQADFPFNVKIVGIIRYDNFTYKLASLNQTEEAKKHGYTDFIEYWDDGENDWCSLEQLCGHDFEVIGNIYKNPELLDIK